MSNSSVHEPESKTVEAEQDRETLLKATVSRVTFRSKESGFSVLRAEPEGSSDNPLRNRELVTVVGVLPAETTPGTSFIARGRWQTHPKFGKQFRAFSFTEAEPTGEAAITRYLGSGSIKGFGPVLAQRVVEHFGEQTLEIIDNEPQRLREVPGIGAKKLQEIVESWQEKRNLREVMLFFQQHNIKLGLAYRIQQAYGDRAIEVVSKNPYILAREMWGIGFRTADSIATSMGLDPFSTERLIAGLIHCLRTSADDGHCFLPKDELISKTRKLLEVEDSEVLTQAFNEACLRGEAVDDNDAIYIPALHLAELHLARRVSARCDPLAAPSPPISNALIEQACNEQYVAQDGSNKVIRLSQEQQQAIRFAAERQMVVITGGPGCGKTTVLRTAASLFRRAGLTVKLAAPTGRAAQRMAEVCGMESSTIHRLLRYDPSSRNFVHGRDEPLELDVLIVDESSMIDLPLATSLFNAVPVGARIIVVGDADQLPSVGPGRLLADLLTIDSVPRVRLTQLFRRAEESLITQIAHEINHAEIPSIPVPDGLTKADAYFLEAKEVPDASSLIEKLVVEQIPKKFGFKGNDIMVLTPMNQGDIGVISLNRRLQERLVPMRPGLPSVLIGNLEFRLGDRVCQRVNNYNIHAAGVFNGDQGEIIGIDAESRSVYVRLWDDREVQYPSETLNQLDLAYALTIHRSQGTEVPVVVMALHQSHTIMLERQLIYTGITRAKKLLIIVGTKKALAMAVKRNRSTSRYTGLVDRVEDLLV